MSGLHEQRDQNREGEALEGGSIRGFPHPPQTWPGSRCYWKGGKSTKKESPPPFPPPAPPRLNIQNLSILFHAVCKYVLCSHLDRCAFHNKLGGLV